MGMNGLPILWTKSEVGDTLIIRGPSRAIVSDQKFLFMYLSIYKNVYNMKGATRMDWVKFGSSRVRLVLIKPENDHNFMCFSEFRLSPTGKKSNPNLTLNFNCLSNCYKER